MPLYFFHLISPEERGVDEGGTELPNVEQAYLEAYQTALDISFEMLRKRRDPSALHFEVTNPAGEVLFDLPFAEALRPTRYVGATGPVHEDLQRRIESHCLRAARAIQTDAPRATRWATQQLLNEAAAVLDPAYQEMGDVRAQRSR